MLSYKMVFSLLLVLLVSVAHAQFSDILFDLEGESNVSYPVVVALGDINEDGFDDIGIYRETPPEWNSGFRIYFGGENMDEAFDIQISFEADTFRAPSSGMSIGDVNNDGYRDWYIERIIVPWNGELVYSVLPGGPNSSYEPLFSFQVTWETHIGDLGDFNGDGFDDLYIYYSRDDRVEVYFGGLPMDTIPDWQYSDPAGFAGLSRPQGVGDINGDGYSDFVTDSWQLMNTAFFFGGPEPDTIPSYEWINFEADDCDILSDITGDGIDDLVVPYGGTLDVHPGGPSLSRVASYRLESSHASNSNPRICSGGDLNGDGIGDMLVSSYGSNTFDIFLGNRWLTLEPTQTIRSAVYGPAFNKCVCAGDVNGDGADDILTCIDNHIIHIYSGNTDVIVPAWEIPSPVISDFSLRAFPNPFNPQSTIAIDLTKQSLVTVELFDILGRQIETLYSGVMTPGTSSLIIDGRNLASGNYLVVAQTSDTRITKRLMLVR